MTGFYQTLTPSTLRATAATVGPWGPALQHGGPPAALLAWALERDLPAGARLGHLAYDFYGPVPVGDVTLETEVVRHGRRIGLLRSALSVGGLRAMGLSAWRLATAIEPTPGTPEREALPAVPGPQPQHMFESVPHCGYGDALEWRFTDGHFDRPGPATVWTRPLVPLVDGLETSPLERLLLMVDSANGISGELDPRRWLFVPVALTVSLGRHPRTEWVGMRARTALEPDGLGTTHALLFDEAGVLGHALQTLYVAPRS